MAKNTNNQHRLCVVKYDILTSNVWLFGLDIQADLRANLFPFLFQVLQKKYTSKCRVIEPHETIATAHHERKNTYIYFYASKKIIFYAVLHCLV